MLQVEPWSYLREILCLLPDWPSHWLLELVPVNWTATASRDDGPPSWAASSLAAKHYINPGKYRVELLASEFASASCQEGLVESHDLRGVGNGILRQAGCFRGQCDVARSCRPLEVARERNADDGANLALIERVALRYQHRAPEPRSRPGGLG